MGQKNMLLSTTYPLHVTIRHRIQKAIRTGKIRNIEVDEDKDIVANCETWGVIGDLTTGMRGETIIQPVVLVFAEERRDWPHTKTPIAQVRNTVKEMVG